MGTPPETKTGIMEEMGVRLCMSGVIGSAYCFLKGFHKTPFSPGGFVGGSQAVRTNVPYIAGSSAVFVGLRRTLECSMAHARGKEDIWNSVTAIAATYGVLKMFELRGNPRASALLALCGFALNKVAVMKKK